MKATKTGARGSQLPEEGSPQKNSAEHEEYAGVHIPERIAETDDTNANVSEKRLLEKIVSRENLNEAYKRVKANKGSHGIDGMTVDALLQYFKRMERRSSSPFWMERMGSLLPDYTRWINSGEK